MANNTATKCNKSKMSELLHEKRLLRIRLLILQHENTSSLNPRKIFKRNEQIMYCNDRLLQMNRVISNEDFNKTANGTQ